MSRNEPRELGEVRCHLSFKEMRSDIGVGITLRELIIIFI